MEAIAKLRNLKGSPRKARLVIDMIRGEDVSRALAILKFTDKRAADPIAKCLNSAIANATYIAERQNIAVDPDDLWVRKCFVDMGPHKNRRRMRPAPQGRAFREQRHYCHITIEVTSEEKPKTEKELKAEAAKAKKADGKSKVKSQKAKTSAPKADKKVKAEKVEEVETPIEETETPIVEETAAVEAPVEASAVPPIEESKPLAAQTDEEKTGSKPAADAQTNINEELERR
ncbi:MAG: 50S ribosomal protein L22 [Pyrinomonadaceae bacterium]